MSAQLAMPRASGAERPRRWVYDRDETFGAVLQRFRLRFGVSQHALGHLAGVNTSFINRLESGERAGASRAVTLALARALELCPEDTDRLLVAAGYASMWAGDRTVQQLVKILAGDAVLAAGLRAQISALSAMVREGDEG